MDGKGTQLNRVSSSSLTKIYVAPGRKEARLCQRWWDDGGLRFGLLGWWDEI